MNSKPEIMNRRKYLQRVGAGAAALALAGCAPGENAAAGSNKLNFVYILADDLGFGDLGCYGQETIKTPNIDRMAREGMKFTEHYAGSTVCAPSRCCLMTGYHTGHSFIRGNGEVKPMGQRPIPADSITIPGLLKKQGYRTGLVGKWGLGGPDSVGHPNKQGFDHFFGYLCQRHAHNYYPEFLFRNQERITLEGNKVEGNRLDGAGVATEKVVYSPDLMIEEALQFIRASQDQSFSLFYTTTLPHANNEGGNEGMEIPDYGDYAGEDWPDAQKGHAAMISRLDSDVGRIMDELKELGLDDNTLVMFTSDNGPHREGGADPEFFNSSGPLRGIKRDLYEGGIRVPLIARLPGRVAAGQVSDHAGAFWDMLPTMVELSGGEVPAGIDGKSMKPSLLGGVQSEHEYLYWEFRGKQAVRKGDWKAVRLDQDQKTELFNLEDDLAETRDLAADNPEKVEELSKLFDIARVESEFFPLKG
jgi:arylsulfatase A-like enzyme